MKAYSAENSDSVQTAIVDQPEKNGWGSALARLFRACFAARATEPWNEGYSAFYDKRLTNTHEAGSAAHQEWVDGFEAADEAFRW